MGETEVTVVLHLADLPTWLVVLAWVSLSLGVLCSVFVIVDVTRHPQPMKVMNVVWPVCALFGSVIWTAAYLWWGRAANAPSTMKDMPSMHMRPALGLCGKPHSMPVSVFIGTSHCGGGCTLADLIVEWSVFAFPSLAVIGGWHWLFSDSLFATWVIAYFVALAIGITFQFAAIAPMNPQRSTGANIRAAAKADILSLTAWQVGMYGITAITQLWLFPTWLGGQVAVDTPVFWFVMQIAMVAGFCTAYPINWWLIKSGIKERM